MVAAAMFVPHDRLSAWVGRGDRLSGIKVNSMKAVFIHLSSDSNGTTNLCSGAVYSSSDRPGQYLFSLILRLMSYLSAGHDVVPMLVASSLRHIPFLGAPPLGGGCARLGELIEDLRPFQVTIARDWLFREGTGAASEKLERFVEGFHVAGRVGRIEAL